MSCLWSMAASWRTRGGDLWAVLPVPAQDALLALALLLPSAALGVLVLRGFATGRLVAAMLWRFRLANSVVVLLIAAAVAIGVGLAAQEQGFMQGSARAAERFNLVIGAPGSGLTLTLAAVDLRPVDLLLLSGAQCDEIVSDPDVTLAVPIAFRDNFGGAPVGGTTADFVSHLAGSMAEGRLLATSSEAVAGAFAPLRWARASAPPRATAPRPRRTCTGCRPTWSPAACFVSLALMLALLPALVASRRPLLADLRS